MIRDCDHAPSRLSAPTVNCHSSKPCAVLVQSPARTSIFPWSSTSGINAFCFEEERKGSVEYRVRRGGLDGETVFDVSRIARENWGDVCGAKTYALLPLFVEMTLVGLYGSEANTGDAPSARRDVRRMVVNKSWPLIVITTGLTVGCLPYQISTLPCVLVLENIYPKQYVQEIECVDKDAKSNVRGRVSLMVVRRTWFVNTGLGQKAGRCLCFA